MRKFLIILLAAFFPYAASAVFHSQVYTTNNQATVDAYIAATFNGPTNGATLQTVSNVVNGMATTLSVLHSTNANNATQATNLAGGFISSSLGMFYTNSMATFTLTNATGMYQGGLEMVLTSSNYPNILNAGVILGMMPVVEQLPQTFSPDPINYTNAFKMTMGGLDAFFVSTDQGGSTGAGVLRLGDGFLSFCSQRVELWGHPFIDFANSVNQAFTWNAALRIDTEWGNIIDGNSNMWMVIPTHDYYALDGTTKMINGSTRTFTGNAAGLTNLQASSIVGGLTVVQTNSWGIVQSIDYVNIDSGKLYTNTTAGNQKIHAHGHVWFASSVVGVSSGARLDMIVNDQYTNSLRWSLNQGASMPVQGDVEGEFVAEVPPGGFYYFTNLSSGGGGDPTNEIINPVQIITTSNIVSRFYFTNGVLMNTTTP